MLHFIYYYAECRNAECRNAECRNAECHYAECRYAECRCAIKFVDSDMAIRLELKSKFLT